MINIKDCYLNDFYLCWQCKKEFFCAMEEYRILENSAKEGVLTLKLDGVNTSFNHSLVHGKDVFEDFEWDDCGIVEVKGVNLHHINGKVITAKEYKFVREVIQDLKNLYY